MCGVSISPEWLEAVSVLAATVLAVVALGTQWADARARRKSTDATISAEAYTVRRTLRVKVFGAQHLQGMGGVPTFDPDPDVEARLQRAIAAAPHASRAVAAAIRDAYVLYYRATAQPPPANLAALLNQNREAASAAALADLHACNERLTAAIDPELRAR